MTEEAKLEELPIHALRSALKDQKIKFTPKDKKVDLIKMLRSGETIHKPKEIKRAPILGENKPKKALAIVPKEIREDLLALGARGLKWTINEEAGCINFMANIPTCANLDQSAKNILLTAKSAFGGNLPVETGRPAGEPVEWR